MTDRPEDASREWANGQTMAMELVMALLVGQIASIKSDLNGTEFEIEVAKVRESIEGVIPTAIGAAMQISRPCGQGVEDGFEDILRHIKGLRSISPTTI